MGVGAEEPARDADCAGWGSGPRYNEPIWGKRCAKRGRISRARFSMSVSSSVWDMEWNTRESGTPTACECVYVCTAFREAQ